MNRNGTGLRGPATNWWRWLTSRQGVRSPLTGKEIDLKDSVQPVIVLENFEDDPFAPGAEPLGLPLQAEPVQYQIRAALPTSMTADAIFTTAWFPFVGTSPGAALPPEEVWRLRSLEIAFADKAYNASTLSLGIPDVALTFTHVEFNNRFTSSAPEPRTDLNAQNFIVNAEYTSEYWEHGADNEVRKLSLKPDYIFMPYASGATPRFRVRGYATKTITSLVAHIAIQVNAWRYTPDKVELPFYNPSV